MTGLLQTIESAVGQTFGIIRENGQVEDVSVVAASAPGGSILPLSNVFFVDQGTASAAPDGSIANPFPTFAAAIAAAAVVSGNTAILLCPADYSAEGPQVWAGNQTLQVSALEDPAQGFGGISSPVIPAISTAGFFGLKFTGLGSLDLQNCSALNGAVLTCNGGVVNAIDCAFETGVSLAGQNVRLNNCEVKNVTITAAGTLVEAVGCNWTVGASVVFSGSAGTLRLDSLTNFYWRAMGGAATVTNGTIVQLSRAQQEIASVVVPAVLAGQVGYVDTNMVGELAAVLANAPVTANPSADLVAAGAGGGFVNCRVSGTGVVRCAFIGPLAGGAVNFTFAAL